MIKVSVQMGAANPASIRLQERLGAGTYNVPTDFSLAMLALSGWGTLVAAGTVMMSGVDEIALSTRSTRTRRSPPYVLRRKRSDGCSPRSSSIVRSSISDARSDSTVSNMSASDASPQSTLARIIGTGEDRVVRGQTSGLHVNSLASGLRDTHQEHRRHVQRIDAELLFLLFAW